MKQEIINKDCIQGLSEMKDNLINLTVTSPPYYAFKDYGDYEGNIENLDDYTDYTKYLDNWLKELFRVTDEDGRVCIIVDDKHTNLKTEGINKNRGTHARLIILAEKNGFIYKDLIIWAKARAGHASGGANYMLGSFPYPPNIPLVNWFEYVIVLRKEGKPRVSRITTEQKEMSKLGFNEFKWASESIWRIPAERSRKHPCPYPEEIVRRLIKLFSFYGDTILDPFAGSGTTLYVSKQLGRNAIGYDINPEYCKITTERLMQEILTGENLTKSPAGESLNRNFMVRCDSPKLEKSITKI